MPRVPLRSGVLLLAPPALLLGLTSPLGQDTWITEASFHLGNDATPEWTEASPEPDGTRLDLEFDALHNDRERALEIWSRHVDERWSIEINDLEIGTLARGAELRSGYYPVPAGTLRDGRNTLSISTARVGDDITVGRIRLLTQSYRELLRIGEVSVRVMDAETQDALPVRLTVVDEEGEFAPVYYGERPVQAVRRGVVYTADGEARFGLTEGSYRIYASRGFEWGVDTAELQLRSGEAAAIELTIRREVDTTGYVAADTHIHTLTFSGHGDASLEERIVTLAGEGVELAIATDHNHHTDYSGAQTELALNPYYTPVVGNEVTSENGHFNAFPFSAESELPPWKEDDWVELVAGIREKGAEVVILNHPRWPNLEGRDLGGPFEVFDLNRSSGERPRGPRFTFDAVEIFNSTTDNVHPDEVISDWFALLNRGERITGVGSSDSHTVLDMVGQGRTYVRSSTDDPAAIEVSEMVRGFRAGATSMSLGIFSEVLVGGRPAMGETLSVGTEALSFQLRVAAPSWSRPETVTVYWNGRAALTQDVPTTPGRPTDALLDLRLEGLPHDGWLVCVVRGSLPEEPFWYSLLPYTAAATNPVWIDVDGDGGCSSPHALAQRLLEEAGSDPASLARALEGMDEAVAVQLASLYYEQERRRARGRLTELVSASGEHEAGLHDFLAELPQD